MKTPRTPDQSVADQVIDLWNEATAKGFRFLYRQSDVEKMRTILDGRGGSDELYVKVDRLADELRAEGHTEVADRLDALL